MVDDVNDNNSQQSKDIQFTITDDLKKQANLNSHYIKS